MAVAVLKQFDLPDLQAMYDHAAALQDMLDGAVGHVEFRTALAEFVLRIEWHFQDIDPLVDRQPQIVVTETLEVQ